MSQTAIDEWASLITAQDDFVFNLISEKAELEALIQTGDNGALHSEIARLKQEVSSLQEQINQPQELVAYTGMEAPTTGVTSEVSLILLAGDTVFFNDGLLSQGATGGLQAANQMRWEVEKDVRLQTQQITGEDSVAKAPSQVSVFVFINRTVLISGLIKAQVISSASTFQEFMFSFNSVPNCFMMDIGEVRPEVKIAAVISLIGMIAPRIYIAGIRPASLLSLAPHLASSAAPDGASLQSHISSKIALINFRESDEDGNWLFDCGAGWRVTTFAGAFSTEAMGTSYGWDGVVPVDPSIVTSASILANGKAAPRAIAGTWEQAGPSSRSARKIKINPNRAFLNQEPQVCIFFHLSPTGCTQKDCGRSHNYIMSPGQSNRLEQDVSKSPCKELKTTGVCRFEAKNGAKCLYSHAPPRPEGEGFPALSGRGAREGREGRDRRDRDRARH